MYGLCFVSRRQCLCCRCAFADGPYARPASQSAVRAELLSMHDGLRLMRGVTEDLLDMERLRAGTFSVVKGVVAVRSAVEACVQQVRSQLAQQQPRAPPSRA